MKQHIFFTGFMASGKSRTGRALAERLGRTFVDTDAVIVERAGKSITDIFAQDGEAAFRQMERDIIAEIARNEAPQVVSLGGGALNQPENLKVIRESGTKLLEADEWLREMYNSTEENIKRCDEMIAKVNALEARRGGKAKKQEGEA